MTTKDSVKSAGARSRRGPLLQFFVLTAGLAAIGGWSSPVTASEAVSVYVVPTKVEMLPTDASATRVVIHGGFIFLSADLVSYNAPRCGTMYFECGAGDETMCRMQWQDLRNGIGSSMCLGFGSRQETSAASVRAEGDPLQSPDAWNLGIGIATGQYLTGQCPIALASVCPLGGALDAGVATDAASGSGGASSSGGAGGAAGASGSASGGASGSGGTSGSGGATGSGGTPGSGGVTGSGGNAPARRGGGCALAASRSELESAWLGMAFIFAGCLFRTGRTRRSVWRRQGPRR